MSVDDESTPGRRAARRSLLAQWTTGEPRIGASEAITAHLHDFLNTWLGESLIVPGHGIVVLGQSGGYPCHLRRQPHLTPNAASFTLSLLGRLERAQGVAE